jgi:glc operon protein GlcG
MNLDDAQRVIGAARAKAEAIGIKVAIAVVDDGAHLVALHRMDGAAPLTPPVAEGKAMAAAMLRRDGGSLLTLANDRPAFWSAVKEMTRGTMVPGLGSVLVNKGGVAAGAVGVSGGRPEQDAECAEAGAASLG